MPGKESISQVPVPIGTLHEKMCDTNQTYQVSMYEILCYCLVMTELKKNPPVATIMDTGQTCFHVQRESTFVKEVGIILKSPCMWHQSC